MVRYVWALSLILLVSSLVCSCQPVMPESINNGLDAETPVPKSTVVPIMEGTLKILFIGDTEIEENWGVDGHLAGMSAAADPPVEILTEHITIENGTLQGYWESTELMDKVRSGEWDWVILHENLFYQAILDNATPEICTAIEESYVEYAGKLADDIQQSGTQTALLLPWEHPVDNIFAVYAMPSMDDVVHSLSKSNIRIVPAGAAWKNLEKLNPDMNLYDDLINFEPVVEGTYLTAAVLYAAVLGRSPVGVDYLPIDILPDTGPGAYFRSQWTMTEEEALFLQQVAWDTVQEYQSVP